MDLKLQAERRKSLLDHHWAVPSKDRYARQWGQLTVFVSVCPSFATHYSLIVLLQAPLCVKPPTTRFCVSIFC